jgi:putative oxidoreductase
MFARAVEPLADPLLLLARFLLALIFVHEGASLILHFPEASLAMAKLGVPPPLLAATIALQLGAGTMLALGWHAREAALALALFCVATAFLFHTNFAIQNELLHFEKDLAIAGGMVVLAVEGSGALSLDRQSEMRSSKRA